MKRFKILGDLAAPAHVKNITETYRKYAKEGIQDDETIFLNWRVVSTKTGRTIAIFGGSAGYDAAEVFCKHCEETYEDA